MRIVSWNIRAGGGKRIEGIFAQLQRWQPEVIALSEFRGTPASQTLAQWLAEAGWHYQFQTIDTAKKATNSLLTASIYPLEKIDVDGAPDQPRRWLLTRVAAGAPFLLANMHIPNYNTGFKYPYHKAVLGLMEEWGLGPAVFLGDTNSGKSYIDDETGIFWRKEHEWMEAIEAKGWVDVYRHLHGEKRVYSWYSHKDNGFRLDQAFFNPEMMPLLQAMEYKWGLNMQARERRDGLSDHAAMLIDLEMAS